MNVIVIFKYKLVTSLLIIHIIVLFPLQFKMLNLILIFTQLLLIILFLKINLVNKLYIFKLISKK